MKYIYSIIIFALHLTVYSQSSFTIKGHITYVDKDVNISDCEVRLVSSSGLLFKSLTDSLGNYSIDSIPIDSSIYKLTITKRLFFSSKQKLNFSGIAHDTTINFQVVFMPIDYYWIPDIHFYKNASRPERKFRDTLSAIVRILSDNPMININIIAHKDSLETKDLRSERADIIIENLIKLGISKDRLHKIISNLPSKYYTSEINYNTREKKYLILDEKYITSLPKNKQKYFRRLNQCVSFKINDDKNGL